MQKYKYRSINLTIIMKEKNWSNKYNQVKFEK